MLRGACQCGAVRFSLRQAPTKPTACHCTQCRKQCSHYFVSAEVPKAALDIEGAENIRWYASSEKVRRGFCSTCGSALFWEPLFRDWTAVALGALQAPTGLALQRHIFTAHKGDYYELTDGLPQDEN